MRHVFSAIALGISLLVSSLVFLPAAADDKDPLFVNIVTDDPHGATMALNFSKTMKERGHPVTVFFNNRGVLLVSKAHEGTYPQQQKEIANLASGGATVIACGHCLGYYGVKDDAILGGVKVGTPDMVSKQLFEEKTKTLTW